MDSNPKVFLCEGVAMPLIGLGTLNFRPNDKTFNLNDHIMNAAKVGITHFNINPNGGNEAALGEAFRLLFEVKKQMEDEDGEKIPDEFVNAYPRQNIFISYKVYNGPEVQKNIKTALQNLKLEYFDLVMLNCPHAPPPQSEPNQNDPDSNPNEPEQKKQIKRLSMMEVWKQLEDIKEKGLCRAIGVSNFTIQALLNLYPFVKIKPSVNEVESHPYLIQKNMHKICKKLKMIMVAYCPLMRGGKDQKQPLGDKIDYLVDPVLKQLSVRYAKNIVQVILNYQICRGVAVIPKTQKLDHLNENFNITDFQLLEEDVKKLEELDKAGKIKVYQLKNTPLWKGEDPLC